VALLTYPPDPRCCCPACRLARRGTRHYLRDAPRRYPWRWPKGADPLARYTGAWARLDCPACDGEGSVGDDGPGYRAPACEACDRSGVVEADACPDCGHYSADVERRGTCGECGPCDACEAYAHPDAMFDRWCPACAPDHTCSEADLLAVVGLLAEAAR